MKRYTLLFIAIFGYSCTDVLVEKPKSIMVENFYNTQQEIESAIYDAYRHIKVYNGFGFLYPCQLESYSDFSEGRGSYSTLKEFQGLDATNVSRIGQIWEVFYRGIRGTNLVIANTPGATQLTEEQKNMYLAEARFLRAFIYFHIVRNWNKAILRTESNMLEQNQEISSREETYKFIEDDLLFSEQNLPDSPRIPGSPSKWSAKTLLGDIYYYQKKYNESYAKAKEVIESGKFNLVPVNNVEDFEKLYGADLVSTSEEIFYLKYSRESGQGWAYMDFTNYQTTPYFNGSGLGGLIMDPTIYSVYNDWDNNDLRKSLWFNWDIGLGSNTLLTRKFIDLKRAGQSAGGNDYPFYRFADVLLQFSEVSCRVNNAVTDEAIEALNMVRRRGYGKVPTASSDFDFNREDFSGTQDFFNVLADEQGYETNMEGGKRWLYLKANDNVKDIIKKRTGKDVADKHFFWPLPSLETDYNEAINLPSDQNPGY